MCTSLSARLRMILLANRALRNAWLTKVSRQRMHCTLYVQLQHAARTDASRYTYFPEIFVPVAESCSNARMSSSIGAGTCDTRPITAQRIHLY